MTRSLSVLLALGLAVPALAETAPTDEQSNKTTFAAAPKAEAPKAEAPMPTAFATRQIDFGISGVGVDPNSSRFREYRAVPTGVVLPFLHFAGDNKFRYDVVGVNVLQKDARYAVRAEPGIFRIDAEYVKIPHSFGNAGRTLLENTGPGNWIMSSTLQQTFQTAIANQFAIRPAGVNFDFLNNLVAPSLASANIIDIGLMRERGRLEVRLTPDKPLDLRFSYFQEKRRGDRAAGTSFGFSNVVETPESIDYRTRDFGFTGEWAHSWGLLRGSFHYNDFSNPIAGENFSNPFRATDSTDPGAYAAPGSGSIGGPSLGRVALPPDNKAVTESLGFVAKFGGNSRFSADASLGQWAQDAAFIPMTTNTAIALPQQNLPGSLNGKINTFSLSSTLTSRPIPHLHLSARFRRYDLSNDTPRISLPVGYVRFDAAFETIPRISVPYGYTTNNLNLAAAYDFGRVSLEGGYKLERWDRTFRETETTTQNLGYGKVDLRTWDWLVLHGSYEKGSRGFSGFEIGRSEDASYLSPGPPVNFLAIPATTPQIGGNPLCAPGTICNLRYDQANKDVERYSGLLELSPGGKATFTASYLRGKDRYTQTTFGLVSADNEAFSAEVNYTPVERFNIYGFYSRENISTFQRGRQSGADISTSSLDDWTSDIKDKVDSFGAGATLGLVKDKADLRLFANYQRVDGNNDIFSPPGGAPALARAAVGGVAGIPFFDDTKIYTLSAELAYKVTKSWTLGLGGWYEKYTLQDSNTSDITSGIVLTNYVPGSFFLAPNDHDYKAHVVYVRASYVW